MCTYKSYSKIFSKMLLFMALVLVVSMTGCGGNGNNPIATDTTAPTVSSTIPASPVPATDVAINKKIIATFSEAMDPATITTANFTVTGPGVTPVTGTVTYAAGGTTATFRPAGPLASSTLYTATITTGAKDLAGNALASNFAWSFTTGTTSAAGCKYK